MKPAAPVTRILMVCALWRFSSSRKHESMKGGKKDKESLSPFHFRFFALSRFRDSIQSTFRESPVRCHGNRLSIAELQFEKVAAKIRHDSKHRELSGFDVAWQAFRATRR